MNGGSNGYNERLEYAAYIDRYRGDRTETVTTGAVTATHQGIAHGHWTTGAVITLNVNYTAQRPA